MLRQKNHTNLILRRSFTGQAFPAATIKSVLSPAYNLASRAKFLLILTNKKGHRPSSLSDYTGRSENLDV